MADEPTMSGRWNPFLDAYLEVKSERDQALALAEAFLELLSKAKKEKVEKGLVELKERIEKNDG